MILKQINKAVRYGVATIGLLCSMSASAALVTVDTSQNSLNAPADNQGWWRSASSNSNSTNDNYITGNNDGYRSYFSFDLAGLSGSVSSATFEVRRYNQTSDLTLGLFDVHTDASDLALRNTVRADIFDDLGTGNSYGTFDVAMGNTLDVLSFDLNLAALNDINSVIGNGFFSIGAAVLTSGVIFSSSGNEPGNGGPGYTQRLILDLSSEPKPVPAPAALGLFAIAFAGIRLSRKNK